MTKLQGVKMPHNNNKNVKSIKSKKPVQALHAALAIVGAVYLGGIPYLAFKYGYPNWAEKAEAQKYMDPELERILRFKDVEMKKADPNLEKNLLEYKKRFPFDTTSVTKEGYPVLYIGIGKWDISERSSLDEFTFYRYLNDKMYGDVYSKTIPMSVATGSMSKFYVIIDMEDANEGCLKVGQKLMGLLIANYFSHFGMLFYINAEPAFLDAHSAVREITTPHPAFDRIDILGKEDHWSPVLLQHIARHDLPKDLLRKMKDSGNEMDEE